MTSDQLKDLENSLWQAADNLRANSGLKASEYATPILGLIFLRFASIRYNKIKPEIDAVIKAQKDSRLQQPIHEIAIAKCGFYLPEKAQYDYLLKLPEEEDVAKAIKYAMEQIEEYKPELKDSLPKNEYFKLCTDEDNSLPSSLLKTFADIPEDATGDVFGKVYEYFLSAFALAEGQGGGEFFTPTSVVKLMVEVIEPYKGSIFDPACGSGGMFVQSSYFVDRRREELHDTDTKDLMVYGADKTGANANLAKLNLAINGLRAEIKTANAYYEDPFDCYGRFDYVMANPPFNVDDVILEKVIEQKRFKEYGIPQNKTKSTANKAKDKDKNTVPNANYLWINLFATSLKPTGRAALVMANSASDARNSEADIRQKLIKSGVIDMMLTLPKNMFYTVTLPATLWFFDKHKVAPSPLERAGGEVIPNSEVKVLFIDARNIFRQIDRAHREFTEEHIQNIATIVRLYRGETERLKELLDKYKTLATDFKNQAASQQIVLDKQKNGSSYVVISGSKEQKREDKQLEEAEKQYKALYDKQLYYEAQIQWLTERFPNGVYEDVTGLCKAATLAEIEEQDWSLNPGRYVGVVIEEDGLTEEEFITEMKFRHTSFKELNEKADDLTKAIYSNFISLI